jgi:hypothetical protein
MIQAKPIHKYGLRFDSRWELSVYEYLLKFFPIEKIEVHKTVELYPEGNDIPELGLNIDFYIPSIDLYIEVKGDLNDVINGPFKVKYHILARERQDVEERLLVVTSEGGKRLPKKGKKTISLVTLGRILKNAFYQIENNSTK